MPRWESTGRMLYYSRTPFNYSTRLTQPSIKLNAYQKLSRVVINSTNDAIEHAVSVHSLHHRIPAIARG
jgi:hypothetical protein